ncbi:MAG: TolC family protein [Candidatus Omnitrophica bacterium]|nr:TolC family protein [Candidatus Omnitrophota bacterium]
MGKRNIILSALLVYVISFCAGLSDAKAFTLEEAVREAGVKNITLKQAEERVRIAESGAAEERTYLLPSFNLSGENAYQRGDIPGGSVPLSSTETDDNTLSLSVTQPLFTGGRLLGQYRISKLAVDFARASHDIVYLDLILNVKSAYFNVLRLEKAVSVSRELVDNRRRHSSEVGKRVQVGVLPKVEQLKTEVELAHSEDALILAEHDLKAAQSGLNRLLERPLETEVILEDVPLKIFSGDISLEYYYTQAKKNRPELKAAAIKFDQAEKGKTVAGSGYFPQISLQLARQEFQEDAFRSDWSRNDQALLVVSYDIWNWGRIRDRVRKSASQLNLAQMERSDLERSIGLEVKKAYLAVGSARARIETAQKAVRQSEEVLRIQSIRFKEGMATNTEVLDADFALAQAKTDYYNASYDYLSAQAVLERSTGQK